MKSKLATWLAVVAAGTIIPAGISAAAVYKCTASDGRVEYRDSPCAGNSGGKVEVRPNVVSAIDQSSNKQVSDEISKRIAARDEADERAARERAAPMASVEPARASAADPVYYYPRSHHRSHAVRHNEPPKPPKRTVLAKPAPRRDED